MEKVVIGDSAALVLDHCTRCGGMWFEYGEVQRVCRKRSEIFWQHVPRSDAHARPRCHVCHAFIDRDAETCGACGGRVALDCPTCDKVMKHVRNSGVTLDVCEHCRGVWFDHHELASLWDIGRGAALKSQRGGQPRTHTDDAPGAPAIMLDALAYSPDLIFWGAHGVSHAGGAVAQGLVHVPEVVGAAAEVAGQAAATVFETIVSIIAGIFS
jgi:Zn-finger nucleic acid-binding protein